MKLKKKHPFIVRWTHWINFPLLSVMIWSGLLIYWANDVYSIGFGKFTIFHFFPEWFYNFLGINNKLSDGMGWHFFTMWFFAINGFIYFTYMIFSGEWHFLVPNKEVIKKIPALLLHEIGLSHNMPKFEKFNPLQQIAYVTINFMGFLSLLTGLAIYKPIQFSTLTFLLGGYEWARFEHFWLTMAYICFFVIHVGQVIKAGWSNFVGMLTGYEISEEGVYNE